MSGYEGRFAARQEAARREKVHREAARQAAAEQARRAQRKAGSVWHPSQDAVARRPAYVVAWRRRVVMKTILMWRITSLRCARRPSRRPVPSSSRRSASRPKLPGRRRRPSAVGRGADAAGNGGPQTHGLEPVLHSAGSRGSMTSIGGHGPPRKMQMPPPAASEQVPRRRGAAAAGRRARGPRGARAAAGASSRRASRSTSR